MEPSPEVTRETTIDATPEEVWRALEDPDARAAWLGGDGADRPLRIDEAIAGERLAWTWWPSGGGDGGGDAPSTVTITLAPSGTGGTSVRVVERLALAAPGARVQASSEWQRRLIGVELLLLVTHAVRV